MANIVSATSNIFRTGSGPPQWKGAFYTYSVSWSSHTISHGCNQYPDLFSYGHQWKFCRHACIATIRLSRADRTRLNCRFHFSIGLKKSLSYLISYLESFRGMEFYMSKRTKSMTWNKITTHTIMLCTIILCRLYQASMQHKLLTRQRQRYDIESGGARGWGIFWKYNEDNQEKGILMGF